MCFSASASFASASLLISAGAYVIASKKITGDKLYLALIPVLFGFQQFFEGVVWLGYASIVPQWFQWLAIYAFSIFATSVWPFYIPLAMYFYERNQKRNFVIKHIQLTLVLFGTLVGLYLLWCSTWYSNLVVDVQCSRIDCRSIAYQYDIPILKENINWFYLGLVIFPFFLSSSNYIRMIVGTSFLFSFFLAAYLSKHTTFPSIWCFLAAAMSITIIAKYWLTDKNF